MPIPDGTEHHELLTVGYGRWSAKSRWQRLVSALRSASVQLLVDIRLSPCSSNLDPTHHYGPRRWHVQGQGQGIADGLREAGIDYLWLVELGNPQKNDAEMQVLKEHLADTSREWPVHRGLKLLHRLAAEERRRCCLMCACKDYGSCHRRVIAERLVELAGEPRVVIKELA